MKIYLDIDDTLLNTDIHNTRPAAHIKEFLQYVVTKHDVYWLTTHCHGDAMVPVLYLSRYVPDDVIELIMKIKPTTWERYKIEAIDLNDDFLWFDDVLTVHEAEVLNANGKLGSFVPVDLDKDPDVFLKYLRI